MLVQKILKTFIFIILIFTFKKQTNQIDIYYIIRFFFPILERYLITKKLFNNDFKDIQYKNKSLIVIPELIIFIYDFFERFYSKNLPIDFAMHHIFTIFLILISTIISENKKYIKYQKVFGIHTIVNCLNFHNIGDIFLRLPKSVIQYNKNIGIITGIFGLGIWFYTRLYIQIIHLKKIMKDSENMKDDEYVKSLIILVKTTLLMGVYFTCVVLKYFYKALAK